LTLNSELDVIVRNALQILLVQLWI